MTGAITRQTDLSRPISKQEAAYLSLQELVLEAGLCNLAWSLVCADDFRADILSASLRWLMRRHPALRTAFPIRGGGPVRQVRPDGTAIPIDEVETTAAEAPEVIRRITARPFDITRDLPIRAVLVRQPDRVTLVLVVHHVAVDAMSTSIVVDELDRCYDELLHNRRYPDSEVQLPEPALEVASPPPTPASLAYWRDHLDGVDAGAMVLRGQVATEPRTFAAATHRHRPGPEVTASILALPKKVGATTSTVLLASFYALLATYGAGPDLVVGTLVTERANHANASRVGLHVLMLALRVRAREGMTYRQLVAAVRDGFFQGLAHSDATFEHVLPTLRGPRPGEWRVPVFRHVFNYLPGRTGGGTEVRSLSFGRLQPVPKGTVRYEIEFNVHAGEGDFLIWLTYATELFAPDMADDLLHRYGRILLAAHRDPDIDLADL